MAPYMNIEGGSSTKSKLEDMLSCVYDGEMLENIFNTYFVRNLVDEKRYNLSSLKKTMAKLQEKEMENFYVILKNIEQEMEKLKKFQAQVIALMKATNDRWMKRLETCDAGEKWLEDFGLYSFMFDGPETFENNFKKRFLDSLGKLELTEVKCLPGKISCDVPERIEMSSKVVPKFTIGEPGTEPGQFSRPWGVCTDFLGRILVADRTNNRIQVFDEIGGFCFEMGKEGSEPGEFSRPCGVAVDSDGRIIVADKDNHRVQIFTNSGAFISSFGTKGTEPGEFNYPWDVAVNDKGDIAVSDSKNCRIQLFNKEGRLLRLFGFNGIGRPNRKLLDMPKGVAFRPDGKLLVADFNNHEILLLDEHLREVRRYGKEGNRPGMLLRPQGIACLDNDTFAVADCKNFRIQVFNSKGSVLECFGTKGDGIGELDCPQGVAYHPNGSLIVVDFGNNRVPVF